MTGVAVIGVQREQEGDEHTAPGDYNVQGVEEV